MHKVKQIISYVRYAATSKVVVLSAFTVLSLGIIGLLNLMPLAANAAGGLPTNDPSNIVSGGFSSPAALVNAYKANNPSDIQAIYNAFGLQTSDLANFQSHAVAGTLKSDGTLVVGGKIVADSAKALGRKGPQDGYQQTTPMTIAGKTYYTTPLSYILGFYHLPSTDAYVLMNGSKVQFVAMNACGNPVNVTQPKEACNMLKSTQVNDNTYQFSTDASASNGATISKVVYDFGDSSATVTQTNPSTTVTHSYTKSGTFTAKVTVYFNYHGQTDVVAVANCQKTVKPSVPSPKQPLCVALNATPLSRTDYQFTVTASPNGATLQSATFTFDDGTTQSANATAGSDIITIKHTYAKPGDYKPSATLDFDTAKKVGGAGCATKLTVNQEECKPGIPVGDTRCTPPTCQTGSTSPECKPPELPSTGPSDVLGTGFGLGSIVAAGSYYVRTRRDLLSTIFKRK